MAKWACGILLQEKAHIGTLYKRKADKVQPVDWDKSDEETLSGLL